MGPKTCVLRAQNYCLDIAGSLHTTLVVPLFLNGLSFSLSPVFSLVHYVAHRAFFGPFLALTPILTPCLMGCDKASSRRHFKRILLVSVRTLYFGALAVQSFYAILVNVIPSASRPCIF